MKERAVQFLCEGSTLQGVLHASDKHAEIGLVLVVAGGPQYRVGVNRQFVMMGRMLADKGVHVLRFDHRGTGDSEGECKGFLDMSADIGCAIDELIAQSPKIKKIVLWGECESASAIAFYAHTDSRVNGIYLVNPWIRTQDGEAKAYLRHYYKNRMLDKKFWQKLAAGKFSPSKSIRSLLKFIHQAFVKPGIKNKNTQTTLHTLSLPERVEKSVERYKGSIQIMTSGQDYIAREFNDYVATSPGWKNILMSPQVQTHTVADADHSFSRLDWRKELFHNISDWIESI